MKEQLIQYVNLLFAGVPDCEDMKQEILQNTLDRYDDLISQGKVPEAAYRLAISGIGDINEILGSKPSPDFRPVSTPAPEPDDPKRKKLRSLAIALYILCALPLIILSEFGLDIMGLTFTLVIVAIATYIMLITSKKEDDEDEEDEETPSEKKNSPSHQLKKSVHAIVDAITLAVYLIVSFATGAWYITWLIFPISGCINGLVNAIIDLKEANKHEN